MNPSCRSRGYQRVTLHAGIQNIIPLILDLGASLNFTIDFDEASQAAAALMPGREEIIWWTEWFLLVRTLSATSIAQRSLMGEEKSSEASMFFLLLDGFWFFIIFNYLFQLLDGQHRICKQSQCKRTFYHWLYLCQPYRWLHIEHSYTGIIDSLLMHTL